MEWSIGKPLEETNRSVHYDNNVSLQDGINVIGNVIYEYDDKVVGKADILYDNSQTIKLAKSSILYDNGLTVQDHIESNKKIIIISVITLVFLLIVFLYYVFVRRPRRHRRKHYGRKFYNHDYRDY